ncbi:MAG TPA: gamma-glutamylcyclotransferase family protein [Solirubrobacteraceae bacterium]|nr:gamma-glutamylcyclotransferase family protein [Solirubrobacteraceae bacterium]
MPGEFVFAYGSLVRDLAALTNVVARDGATEGKLDAIQPRPARLRDHRRAWNVAMDNALTLPGYKYYLDARDGSRPEVHVAFLNLLAAPGHVVNGMLVPVEADQLSALDRRERNYLRHEVTELSETGGGLGSESESGAAATPARVWTYYGRPEACRRFEDGRRAGCVVVDQAYLENVRAGFAALAADGLAEFERSTEPHGCRVLALTRVEVG